MRYVLDDGAGAGGGRGAAGGPGPGGAGGDDRARGDLRLVSSRAEPESPEQLARRVAAIVDSKQGSDIVALDVRGLVGYTDFLVICTARNERQAKAIHEEVHKQLKDDGL